MTLTVHMKAIVFCIINSTTPNKKKFSESHTNKTHTGYKPVSPGHVHT